MGVSEKREDLPRAAQDAARRAVELLDGYYGTPHEQRALLLNEVEDKLRSALLLVLEERGVGRGRWQIRKEK